MGSSAPAQNQNPLSNSYIGVSVGTYLPSQGRTRDVFGSSPVSYGATLAQPYKLNSTRLRFDFDALSLNNDGNRFFMIGASVGYTRGFGATEGPNRNAGFFRVGVGPSYYNYDITQAGLNSRGNRISFYGAAELGYTVAKNVILSARYLQTPRFDGYDFSGIELKVTLAAFKL